MDTTLTDIIIDTIVNAAYLHEWQKRELVAGVYGEDSKEYAKFNERLAELKIQQY
ncbi:hypothetical protein FDI40_gp398 [Agrobacterium phage Atu_ph07]|uniref:Uncharacterized protein n=1 Tax=Agrobacterium phage Atu_ph07 TaxID=2024264 RepID=A0A2L0V046_9CAUD|nr:hypothetical protein FDI40_gp398 [Agrobacterium phage Atu_ph07]AUZ95157.1 hypothetical protein [Agrobacterium phage Atu_ph07]